jgi:AcrR family transcriptional regulator
MPRPSQEDKILEAALDCFARNGYAGTRIRHIAEKAGVTEGALYRHYASKEEIAQALYLNYFTNYSETLQEISKNGGSVKERLGRIIRISLEVFRRDVAGFTFVLLRSPSFSPAIPQGFVYPVEVVEEIIKEGQSEGIIVEGQPNLLAAIFLGCILRPLIVSLNAAPGALDLINETRHDRIIEEAALRAICL